MEAFLQESFDVAGAGEEVDAGIPLIAEWM
jgi:hypothetical protein